jgi:hypothetical protein
MDSTSEEPTMQRNHDIAALAPVFAVKQGFADLVEISTLLGMPILQCDMHATRRLTVHITATASPREVRAWPTVADATEFLESSGHEQCFLWISENGTNAAGYTILLRKRTLVDDPAEL